MTAPDSHRAAFAAFFELLTLLGSRVLVYIWRPIVAQTR